MKLENVNTKDCKTVREVKALKKVTTTAVYKAINQNRLDYVELDKIKLVVINYKFDSFAN